MSPFSGPIVDLPAWHLDVEGCTNFRDAGGWATTDGGRMRTGLLYRSDDPIRLTASGRAVVESLGLRLVVDLRQRAQFERGPGFGCGGWSGMTIWPAPQRAARSTATCKPVSSSSGPGHAKRERQEARGPQPRAGRAYMR